MSQEISLSQEKSTITLETMEREIGKPYRDLRFLLEALAEVLRDNGEPEIAGAIPWINNNGLSNDQPVISKLVQLYSLIFQLINMVEINHAVQSRRAEENQDPAGVKGLWARNPLTAPIAHSTGYLNCHSERSEESFRLTVIPGIPTPCP